VGVSAPCSLVELRVYDRDATTLRNTVSATGASWLDPLGEIGSATLTAPLVQTVLAADPTLLNDSIIKVATNLTGTTTLTEVFGFLGEGGELTLISDAENAGKERSLQCRGLLGILDDWIVYPETGIHARSGDRRTFGWMSAASARWFDETQWTGTIRGVRWEDVSSSSDRYLKPKNWPDLKAQWVDAGNNKEKQYFRTSLTVDSDTAVRMYASADDSMDVYLDSELIISSKAVETGYTEMSHWRGVLTAGTHTIGIKFIKDLSWTWGAGWLGDISVDTYDRMIFTCCSIRPNGAIKEVLRHSSDSAHWLAIGIDDGVQPPAWSAGGIIGQLVREARTRGVDTANTMAFGYTDTQDTDGNNWPDLHERSWPVGTSGSKVAMDLGEHDIDFDMTHDLTLNAYVNQGSDVSATVALEQGVNLLSYKARHTPVLATSLLGRTRRRWISRTDSGAEAVYDRREGWLSLGNAASRLQGRHHLDRALDDTARDRYSYTAEFVAVTGCVPYLDFGKGDTVMAYDQTMTATPLRVVSISGSVGEGPIRWTVELEEP
jgi:hypothetical protein